MKNYLSNYLTLIIAIVFTILFLLYYLTRPVTGFFYAGLCILVPSLIMFTIARIQLGDAFQITAEAHKLVKTGIYKKIRHPVYLFGFTYLLGLILITQTFFLLLVLIILIPLQIKRIQQEEKVLGEKFGTEYLDYKKQTWF